ncbi:NUDIX hydrolase [Streptomyces sp. NPDC002537]
MTLDTARVAPLGTRVRGLARITDENGHLLYLIPGSGKEWVLPGGLGLPGESAADALAYHVRHALGVHVTPGAVLVVESPSGDDGKPAYLIDCGTLSPEEIHAIRLPIATRAATREYLAYGFADTAELSTRLHPAHRRLLKAAEDRGSPPHRALRISFVAAT